MDAKQAAARLDPREAFVEFRGGDQQSGNEVLETGRRIVSYGSRCCSNHVRSLFFLSPRRNLNAAAMSSG